jgi:hypothetical protein
MKIKRKSGLDTAVQSTRLLWTLGSKPQIPPGKDGIEIQLMVLPSVPLWEYRCRAKSSRLHQDALSRFPAAMTERSRTKVSTTAAGQPTNGRTPKKERNCASFGEGG